MIVDDQRSSFVPGVEDRLDEALIQELSAGQSDGLMFFARAGVEKADIGLGFQKTGEGFWGDLDAGVVGVGLLDMRHCLFHRDVFIALADLSQRFGGLKTAASAAADVVFGKKSSLCARIGSEELRHGGGAVNVG